MIRGLWDRETVAILFLVALLPLAATWLSHAGWAGAIRLLFFLLVAGIWHLVFMLARAQPPSFAGAITALALAMLVPGDLGVVPTLLGTSFGVVIAELAFGGWGRNVLNPATVTLAFLGFGFPAAPWPDMIVPVGWAAVPVAVIGVFIGILSLRILTGAGLTFGIGMALGLDLADVWTAVAVGLVLLVCDPVASASTQLGRWLNGALFGALVALFVAHWTEAAPVQIVVSAALIASLAAPLLDEAAIALWLARRRRRLG
ncbi:RnfABCDGE type electron transport complex subunit D [Tropicimonas isoalkanivorans]|uniref:Na+-transporting NADH:ubiquinone oxidoreductase subunit B n=1 Tax=Tropicimonas isoalkanivorans TaxID=441112 RepID=A0A1I1QYA9_9RHOB|nr:RnfABCDGE type electron transport complex subunit D [Tropicimonas isoalkanivorans]SFD26977.1 Na+-transporting NADH:ubiquinone oxidoreductase subunit B [Tropicimonas isoalkanivorans]